MKPPNRNHEKGFSFIELLLAFSIVVIGFLSTVSMLTKGIVTNRIAMTRAAYAIEGGVSGAAGKDGRVRDRWTGEQGKKGAPPASTASISVKIIPERPRATDDLRAVVSIHAEEAAYRWLVNGKTVVGATGARLSGHPSSRGDKVRVVVEYGSTETDSFVTIENSEPVIEGVNIGPLPVRGGHDVSSTPVCADPDNDFITYEHRWSVNGTERVVLRDNVLEGRHLKRGDTVVLTVTPRDVQTRGRPFTTAPIVVSNGPPVFTSVPADRFSGQTYTYMAKAYDPDGDPVVFTLREAPRGMSIEEDGRITWKIGDRDRGADKREAVEVVASDGHGLEAIQSYEILVDTP